MKATPSIHGAIARNHGASPNIIHNALLVQFMTQSVDSWSEARIHGASQFMPYANEENPQLIRSRSLVCNGNLCVFDLRDGVVLWCGGSRMRNMLLYYI